MFKSPISLSLLLASALALTVRAAPPPKPTLFVPAIGSAAIDLESSCVYQVATQKRVPVNPDEFLIVLGLREPPPQRQAPVWGAGQTVPAEKEQVFQYVIAFRQPVSLGSLLLAGTPQTLEVLKPDITAAPDPANDAQWQALTVPAHQPGVRVVPFPVGFQTRALRLTDHRDRGWSQVYAVRFLTPRLFNATPLAQAYGESEYSTISGGGGPSVTYAARLITQGTGPWQNTGPNNFGRVERPPVSDVEPAWFILSWKDKQPLQALWLASDVESLELDYFDGPADLNPRAATEREWRRIRQPQRTAELGGDRWEFDPVQTRGLRLRVLKVKPQNHGAVVTISMLHAYADLKAQPVPAPQVVAVDNAPVAIPYHLDRNGIVTLVVNDATGHRVRNLIARVPQKQGDQVEYWDLRDENGLTVPAGTYQLKGLTHPGLAFHYQMTPYPNVVDNSPTNAPWLTAMSGPDGWMADHTPPRAAVATGDHVYLGATVAESGVSFIECDLTGRKLWAEPSFTAWTGSYWLGADDQTVYSAAPAWGPAVYWNVDPATEAIWAIDIKTHKVREFARLIPTAQRKRGLQAIAARDGKLCLSVRAPNDWLAAAASSGDVDIEKCYPVYKVRRKERHAYEVVADPRNDFMRLFRLTGEPPGGGSETGGDLIYLDSTRGSTPRQHIVLAFKKPVAIGSAVYPVPRDPKVHVQLSILKPSAPYPPNPGRAADWLPFTKNGTTPWDVGIAPSNAVTRALRITFNRGEDDIFGQEDESALFGASNALDSSLDAGIESKADTDLAHDAWQGQLEGLRLLRRRYENLTPTAKVRVSSGTVDPGGVWDAQRTQPLSESAPGIYALEWAAPQKLRGLAFKEIDGKRTKIDVYTGPAAGPIDINGREGWEEVANYVQSRRNHWSGTPGFNALARYLDGCVDFGKEISTRAVRLRVLEQWADNSQSGGLRPDQGGTTLDAKRCRVYGVAALQYVGGETPNDPLTFQRVEVLDTASGKVVNEVALPEPGPIAFNPAGELIAVSGTSLVKVNLQGGPHQTLASDLVQPQTMACDSKGNLYVYDHAPDRRVIRVYDPSGKHVRDIGEPGGYRVGPWNPNRLHDLTAITIDKLDQLWAVDTTYFPKRISLWDAPSGTFKKDFFGNTAYGGGGVLDPWDKHRLFYGHMEFALDWETGRTSLKNLTWLGDTRAGEIPIQIGDRTYLVTRLMDSNPTQPCGIVYLYEKDHLKMVAAVGSALEFPPLLQPSVQAGLGFKIPAEHSFIWTDRNGDGAVQADEVTLTRATAGMGALTSFNRDLGIQGGQIRYQVKEFLPNGAPVYEMKPIPGLVSGYPFRLDDGSYFCQSGNEEQHPREVGIGPDGKLIWSYPTLGGGVQAIAKAAFWSPDQVVCEFGMVGHETVPTGDLGEFIVFHTNLGGWNLWTADGLLAATIFHDQRDPQARSWTMKEHERGLDLSNITVGQEHFAGYLARSFTDNKFYAVAGHNHASVVEVSGLDQFKRFGSKLTIGLPELVQTADWEKRHEKEAVYERTPVIDCYRLKTPPQIDGVLTDWPAQTSASLANGGASFQIGYDDRYLYLSYNTREMGPLKNTGEQWDRLFKTGAAVDLQIATDPQAPADRKAPVAGDKRLLMTWLNNKPIAVLYNAVVPGTPAEKVWQAISPVAKVSFDQVAQLDNVRLATKTNATGYVVEAAIPLADLSLKPQPDLRLKMDWGVLVTDNSGNAILRREYWANHATGVLADVPSEARLNPDLWGYILFHGSGEKIHDNLANPDLDKPAGNDKLLKEFEKDLDEDLKGQ